MSSLDALTLVRELIALPGPPGQEDAVRSAVIAHVEALGCAHVTDARGNLLISEPGMSDVPERADIVVMAHLDEIALMVSRIDAAGKISVSQLGGLFPWKWGETPVDILASSGFVTGILSFGSIHSESKESAAVRAKTEALTWDGVRVFTGLSRDELTARGVRPGTRVVLAQSRRIVTEFGDFIGSNFLDDRADLAAMLLTLEALKERGPLDKTVVFAATAAEEVGGLGALYLLRRLQPEIGIALEIGPIVPDSSFPLDAQPTVWVNDSYSAMQAADVQLVADAAEAADIGPIHWQALSRGGSDASCSAQHGMIARPFTLAFAAENSHGYEIMHKDAVPKLADLLLAVLEALG